MPNLSTFIHTGDTQMLFAMEYKQFRIKDNVFSLEKKQKRTLVINFLNFKKKV